MITLTPRRGPAAPAPLTDAEAAILRSWLGGNDVHDIARGRRTDVRTVTTTIASQCDFQRPRGQRVLFAGHRIERPEAHVVSTVPVHRASPKAQHRRPRPAPAVPQPVPTLTEIAHTEQYRIIIAFAHGHRLSDIATNLHLPLIYVAGVVGAICGLDRLTARRQAIRYLATRPKERTHV